MPVLENPRWEQFANLVAAGNPHKEAYVSAGYKQDNANKCANRLSKVPLIRSRIDELSTLASQFNASQTWLNRNFVLDGLRKVFVRAMEIDKLGDANTTLKMMGQELGMFVDRADHTFHWDGDPGSLDDRQLETLTFNLEKLAYGEERARLEAAKRRALTAPAAAQVIEAVAEPEPEPEPEEEPVV